MKRLVYLLLAAVAAGLLAYGLSYRYRTIQDPNEWLGRRLGLEGRALSDFTEAHNRYAIRCSDMCERIAEANSALAGQVIAKRELDTEVRDALRASESRRADCKEEMLKHFYSVAKMLEKEKQEEYLRLVLPLITEQDTMEQSHR